MTQLLLPCLELHQFYQNLKNWQGSRQSRRRSATVPHAIPSLGRWLSWN